MNKLWKRLAYAVALALDVFCRLVTYDEQLTREPLLSLKKLSGEGALSDLKTVLGWENRLHKTYPLPSARQVRILVESYYSDKSKHEVYDGGSREHSQTIMSYLLRNPTR